ncbi:MAG: hypothetical protein CFE26_18825, partial [Verrucomicrobiales bacterium VVV1]
MSALALEIDRTLRQLDATSAARLEKLVRDALATVKTESSPEPDQAKRQGWLNRLDQLRASVGTGQSGTSTEAILDDLRSDRD